MEAYAPLTLDEALELRAAHPGATVVAGGTDVMVDVNFRRLRPTSLLDLSHVEELREWHWEPELVSVGAGVSLARVARDLEPFHALAGAAGAVGSPQIRNRATLGGNIGTASPAGDAVAALAAYDAAIVVGSRGGARRRVPWSEFFLGPKRTALAPKELILAAEWRPATGPGFFAKVGPRNAMVIAVASVCLQLDIEAHAVRLALGSVGPTVLRAPRAEAFAATLDWEHLSPAAFERLGELAALDSRPIDDLRGSAAYRRHAVSVLARRALAWAVAERPHREAVAA